LKLWIKALTAPSVDGARTEAGTLTPEPRGGEERRSYGAWLRFLISAGVLTWLIARADWRVILETLVQARWELSLLAVIVYCLAQIVSSRRWQLLAAALGLHAGLRYFVAVYYVGMFFNLFLPTSMGGDVARACYLAKTAQDDLARGFAGRSALFRAALSVLTERGCGLAALLFVACMSTLATHAAAPPWALWTVWALAAAAVLGVLASPWLARHSLKWRALVESWGDPVTRRQCWAKALWLSLVVQACGIVEIWLLGVALGLPLPLMVYALVVPLVSLLTLLPISVNGVGLREGGLMVLLTPMGVLPTAALSLGLMWFCVTAMASLIGGGVYAWGPFSRFPVRESHGSVRSYPDQGRTRQPPAAA
jgi:uncharacterized membrane protein YbhN (UPF0104 family)